MIELNLRGLEDLIQQLGKIENGLEKASSEGIVQITKKAQNQAKQLVPVHQGELRESIKTRFHTESDSAIGEVFTNKKYAPYVEFGTGPNGQASAPPIPEGLAVTYSQTGWIIPASAMDVEQAQAYGFGVLTNKDGVVIGYTTNGQRAQPYMVPALRYAEKIAEEEIKEAIQRVIERGG